MKYYLNNSKANNGIKANIVGKNIIEAVGLNYQEFIDGLKPEDEIVLVGGDGTINYFINNIDIDNLKHNVYLYANGTGNDFLNDINETGDREVLLNKYFKNLPFVEVNGVKKRFINNMAFGIDGYCCEEADRIKAKKPNKRLNYTTIALKGLLFDFKTKHAFVNVDGKEYEFENVWLAPTMKGRFFGGGMKVAPDQDRLSDELTLVVYSCKSKFKSLTFFPNIFTGAHVKNTKLVHIFTGKKMSVRYSEPCAAQIDGETVLNVTEYTAYMK